MIENSFKIYIEMCHYKLDNDTLCFFLFPMSQRIIIGKIGNDDVCSRSLYTE